MIKRLNESTVNRIAAGEIIHRPVNAVKELIENCIDAQSTTIQVILQNGGIKLIQIIDDGKGILKDDFELVCERFCTSKLNEFDDLKSINTYGFRGEALASISHISHVQIISKTSSSPCAFKGTYNDGKLLTITPIAGNQGTNLSIQDLFYNLPTRQKAFKNHQEEYNRVLYLVQKYAIQNTGISFICKKHGSNRVDIQTAKNATRQETLKTIYGPALSKELLSLKFENPDLSFTLDGEISNPNYTHKKKEFILFINERLVECPELMKAIDIIYTSHLPKPAFYFAFLSLKLPPHLCDVNCHPTKNQVAFVGQQDIIESVCQVVGNTLDQCVSSRTFYPPSISTNSQSFFSFTPRSLSNPGNGQGSSQIVSSTPMTRQSTLVPLQDHSVARKVRVAPQKLVRTDSRTRTLDSFFVTATASSERQSNHTSTPFERQRNQRDTTTSEQGPVEGTEQGKESIIDTRGKRNRIESESEDDESGIQVLTNVTTLHVNNREPTEKDVFHQNQVKVIQIDGDDGEIVDTLTGDDGDDQVDDEGNVEDVTDVSNTYDLELVNVLEDELIQDSPTSQDVDSNEMIQVECDDPIICFDTSTKPFINVQLESILDIRSQLRGKEHKETCIILRNHTFVGCFNTQWALVQHQTILYLVDYVHLSYEYFYQLGIFGFSNFGVIRLQDESGLFELIMIGSEGSSSEFDARVVQDNLIGMRAMLAEYFSILITSSGKLVGIPNLLPNSTPCTSKLAQFVYSLGTKVDYTSEKQCFLDIAECLAWFYMFEYDDVGGDDDLEEAFKLNVEHVLFPALRQCICFQEWISDGTIRQIVSLGDLYKIFERC